ncbi:MAG: sulfatase-like hydrolase/transferase, partial [Saprospiraceae bacterium]|nr:sulfatase-like hydrolase/transferase [Saprospiraceae bacterium]
TCLLLFACLSFSCQEKTEASQPNILWITCEDISPNLGCYGDPYARTPNLDSLASRGVLYNHAFATAPVCAVARSSIISGLYATSIGSQHMRCRARRPAGMSLYPELLREGGYYCTNNAKTDYNLDMDHKSIWDQCDGEAHWRSRENTDQPFFSIFNLTTSHESRVNDQKRYRQAIEDLEEDMLRKPGEVPVPSYFPDVSDVQELWSRYYNIITAMDKQVGSILAELEEDGLTDETIVLFYSDHGAGVPRHKRWLFDAGIHIPLIVYAPEKYQHLIPHSAGSEVNELVSFIDLAPTALKLADISIPETMHGRAFLGKNLTPEREYIYAGRDRMDERYDVQRAVRDQRYKYIRYYQPDLPICQYMNTPEKGAIMQAIRRAEAQGTMPGDGLHIIAQDKPQEALYDCLNDPSELINLVDQPKYADKLNELREAHHAWSDDYKDTGLLPETLLRAMEDQHDQSIYELMRAQDFPISLVRQAALKELSIDEMITNSSHEQSAIRFWCTQNMGDHYSSDRVPSQLQAMLRDSVPLVRFAAAESLLRNQVKSAGQVLVKGLNHHDEWVRLAAALSLDQLGELARPHTASLQAALRDDNKYVVRVVNHALNLLLGTQNEVP